MGSTGSKNGRLYDVLTACALLPSVLFVCVCTVGMLCALWALFKSNENVGR